MIFYLVIFFLLIFCVFGLFYWIYKIIQFYKTKQSKKATIHLFIFIILFIFLSWELRIIPISQDNDFKNKTKNLTGKKFWSWNIYRFDDFGFRDGFTIETYKLNEENVAYFKNPNPYFFTKYPNEKIGNTKWKKTPLKIEDTESYKFVTPIYGNWSKKRQLEVQKQYDLINKIINEKGSYYSIQESNQTDFYLISPKYKVIIWINHDM